MTEERSIVSSYFCGNPKHQDLRQRADLGRTPGPQRSGRRVRRHHSAGHASCGCPGPRTGRCRRIRSFFSACTSMWLISGTPPSVTGGLGTLTRESCFGLAKEAEQDRILARRLEAARRRVGKLDTPLSYEDRGGTIEFEDRTVSIGRVPRNMPRACDSQVGFVVCYSPYSTEYLLVHSEPTGPRSRSRFGRRDCPCIRHAAGSSGYSGTAPGREPSSRTCGLRRK
jgi:hypothetical protein